MQQQRLHETVRFKSVLAVAIGVLLCHSAFADWQGDFTNDGLSSSANALVVYGNSLVVGGYFGFASGDTVNCIASWDGTSWNSLDGGMLGSTPRVVALTVYGGNLIAAGGFSSAGGVSANNIAKWDGRDWAPLGNGINGVVTALTVYNGDLIAGGLFTLAGTTSVSNIAKWNGSSWSALGAGREEQVLSLAVLNNVLYAGSFYDWMDPDPNDSIGSWNGSAWSNVGSGLDYSVQSLCVYAETLWLSERLIAGGFNDYLSMWNGTTWADYGDQLDGTTFGTFELVLAMVRDGSDLYVTGHFLDAGNTTVNHIARWDGTEYHALDAGLDMDIYPADDAFGSALLMTGGKVCVAGTFSQTGSVSSDYVGKWDPSSKAFNEAAVAFEPQLGLRAFPTPANPRVSLSYRLEQPSQVQLKIFDIRGLHVATARDGFMEAGDHTDSWNGQNSSDMPAPSGIYFAVLEANGRREATRVILAR